MASIPDLSKFNNERRQLVAFNKEKEEALLLTADEVKAIVRNFLRDELNQFAHEVAKERREELETLVIAKLADIEGNLMRTINNKITKVAERVYQTMLTSEFEVLVKKAVEGKIEKIKKELLKRL
jgi:hypothetical protein